MTLTLITPRPVTSRAPAPSSIPADSESSGDIPLPTPTWGMHTGSHWPEIAERCDALRDGPPPLNHTCSAALLGDAAEFFDRRLRDERESARTKHLLMGALVGFCLALVVVVGGVVVIAALDRAPIPTSAIAYPLT